MTTAWCSAADRDRSSSAIPRPGWVEHDPEQLWSSVTESAADALAAAGIVGRRHARDRHHQPARDDDPVGAVERAAGGRRDRVAGPPHGRLPARAAAGRPDPRAHRPRPRPLLLGHQAGLAARARGRRRRDGPGVRHGRQLADLEADRRRGARHRSHQRLAHACSARCGRFAGTTGCWSCSACRPTAAGDRPSSGDVRRGPAAGSAAAGDGRGRRPAGGAVRPGLPRRPGRPRSPTAPAASCW